MANPLDLVMEERQRSRPIDVRVISVTPATLRTNSKSFRAMSQHEYTLEYFVSGTDSDSEVRERLENQTYGLPRFVRGRRLSRYSISYLGNLQWNVTANYSDQIANVITAASTGGGQETIFRSAETIIKYPSTAPDMDQAIEYDNKKVRGTNVTVPAGKFTFVWRMARWEYEAPITMQPTGNSFNPVLTPDIPAEYPQSYNNWLELFLDYTGKTCDAEGWSTYGERQLMLMDATPRMIDNDTMEIQLEFGVKLDQKVQLPDSIVSGGQEITVKGWDYLWYRFADTTQDQGTGGDARKIKLPVATHAYIERLGEMRRFKQVIPPPVAYEYTGPVPLDATPASGELETLTQQPANNVPYDCNKG